MNVAFRDQATYVFGRFRLDRAGRALTHDGTPVNLPPRLFDTLLYLVEHAGRVVEREELLRAVWSGRVVDDSNLKQTIFTLRKALDQAGEGGKLIVTEPSRGYRFAGAIRLETAESLGSSAMQNRPALAAPPALPGRAPFVMAISAAAVAVAMIAATFLIRPAPNGFPTPPAHSLAVLAFSNLSGDPAQSYISDGISDELIGALGRIPDLHVAARTSAFSFRGSAATIDEIGRRLHVGAVLEGSVRRDGSHLRITAELIDAGSGFTLWSRSYDRQSGDLLRVQADIAGAVIQSLKLAWLGGDMAGLIVGGTENPAAFDAYLRAVHQVETASGPAEMKLSLPDFDRAIALDPGFAMARARHAHALLVIANIDAVSDLALVHRRLTDAIREAERALATAPGLGIAHLTRGAALMSVQDSRGADREIALAHALSPNDAGVMMDYAVTQLQFGRTQTGIAAARQAAALDPLTPTAYLSLASALLAAQRDDEAGEAAERARILGGGHGADLLDRAIALDRGDYQSVIGPCSQGQALADTMCLARAYHGLGREADATAQLTRLHTMLGDNGAYQYAEILAQWGRPTDALEWLQTAYQLHDTGLVLMKSDPLLGPIRATTAFQDIERRLDFPP